MYGAGGVRVGACFNFDGNVSRNFFVVCFMKGFSDVLGGFARDSETFLGGRKVVPGGGGRAVGCVVVK